MHLGLKSKCNQNIPLRSSPSGLRNHLGVCQPQRWICAKPDDVEPPTKLDLLKPMPQNSRATRRDPFSELLVKNQTPTAPAIRHCPMAMFRASELRPDLLGLVITNQTYTKALKVMGKSFESRHRRCSKRIQREKPWCIEYD